MAGGTSIISAILLVLLPLALSQIALPAIYRTESDDKLHTYSLAGAEGTWAESKTKCEETTDATLATIEDANSISYIDTNLALMGVADTDELWIGASGLQWVETVGDTVIDMDGFTIASGEDTALNDYIYIDYVDSGPSMTFVADADAGTHGVLCEYGSDTTGMGDLAFTGTVGGAARFFFAATTSPQAYSASLAICTTAQAGSWIAAIVSDSELAEVLALATGLSADVEMWIGVTRASTWTWINDEVIDASDNGFATNTVPTADGFAYLTYTLATTTSVWASDATGGTSNRDAICEKVSEPEESICLTGTEVCYSVETTAATWAAGQTACKATDDTDLAVITSKAQMDFINQNLARLGVKDGDDFWIGAEIDIGSGVWMWMDSVSTSAEATEGDYTLEENTVSEDAAIGVYIEYETDAWKFVQEVPAAAYGVLCEGDAAFTTTDADITTGAGDTARYFGYVAGTFTWNEAREKCRDQDAWMANVGTDAFLLEIATKLAAETPAVEANMWVGLYRNDWTWADGTPVAFDAWDAAHPVNTAAFNAFLTYEESGITSSWQSIGSATKASLCQTGSAGGGGDDGLSDGEIAAIAVSSVVVVGAAAGGGGYYAYSKSGSKGTVAPDDGGESGEGGKDEEEEEEEGGDAQPEEVQED